MTGRRGKTTTDPSKPITGALLDQIFLLRFPWAGDPNSAPDLPLVLAWTGGDPTDAQEHLIEIAWPALRPLTYADASTEDVAAELLAIIEQSPDNKRFPRAVGLVMLLDQCPRMHHANGTNAIWAARYFDPLAQHIVWALFNKPNGESIMSYDAWERLGFSRLHFWVITALIMSAADHSERIEHHRQLQSMVNQRRREIEYVTGGGDHFGKQVSKANDVLAFSQYMRRPRSERPQITSVYDYLYERLMIADMHYPIIEMFGRYPWRNFVLGRENTAAEEEFLDCTGHFGEPSVEVQERLRSQLRNWKQVPFL